MTFYTPEEDGKSLADADWHSCCRGSGWRVVPLKNKSTWEQMSRANVMGLRSTPDHASEGGSHQEDKGGVSDSKKRVMTLMMLRGRAPQYPIGHIHQRNQSAVSLPRGYLSFPSWEAEGGEYFWQDGSNLLRKFDLWIKWILKWTLNQVNIHWYKTEGIGWDLHGRCKECAFPYHEQQWGPRSSWSQIQERKPYCLYTLICCDC